VREREREYTGFVFKELFVSRYEFELERI